MGLTKPRAHQLQDIDYKQTTRAVTTSNVTLSGGAPATVDGVSLTLRDRVLVTGQSTGSENGIYYVTSVGAGSNGTWARSLDADTTGEVSAGMIIMVTEGTTYADTQWKLTTDDPITIGSTSLTFVRNGNAAYGTVAVSGEDSIVADAIGDTLTVASGNNISLTTNASTDTLTVAVSDTITATGNITGGNITTAGIGTFGTMTDGTVSFTSGNISGVDELRIDQSGTGLRMTNVGAFDNDGSDNFRIFSTNDLKIAANGENGTAITVDATNQDVTVTNDLRVDAGNLYIGGTAVTATATELNLLDGVTGLTLGTANEILIVGSDNTSIEGTDILTIDTVSNYVGINQTSPEVTLHMTGEGAQTAQIRMEQYNDSADAPDLRTRRYRGTIASPSAVSSGDYLYRSNHEYWNGSALIVGGTFAFDNTNNANRTQFAVSVTTDGTSADANTPSKVQFKIDGNDSGAITFNNAYKFPTSDGTADQVLVTDGAGTLSFADASGGGATVSSDTSTNTNFLLYFASTTTGALTAVKQDSGLTYNPSTGLLTSAAFSGSGASLTALNGSNISTGTVAAARVATLNQNTTGTAGGLSSAVTVSLSGDVTGSATFTSAGDTASIATTIAANSVALGTDTTGNYVGTITGGTGIASSGATTGEGVAHTLSVDLSELTDMTGGMVGTDEFIVLDAGADRRKAANEIGLSIFNNDAGFTTNTGDITNVAVSGTGLSGGGASGSVTITSNATNANTASTIVARDGSGNFSAGVITATLTGTASNAALLDNIDSSQFLRSDVADTKTSGNLSFNDSVKVVFGTGDDLTIHHEPGFSIIRDQNANPIFIQTDNTQYGVSLTKKFGTEAMAQFIPDGEVNLYYNNSLKLATKSDGVDITGELQSDSLDVDGAADISGTLTLGGNLNMGDNDLLQLGASSDLRIYHDGTDSRIHNQSTGSLIIRNDVDDQDILLQTDNGSGSLTTYVRCDGSDGVVRLYRYGSEKLATKSDGVDITGELQADSLDVDGAADISGQVNFHSNVVMDDNNILIIGNGSDLQLSHNGSNSLIADSGTGNMEIRTNGSDVRITGNSGTDFMAQFVSNGEARLYYDGAEKLNTTSGGVTITGVMTGTATSARYADLAEKYTSDQDYEPGTVVELGGEQEITITRRSRSTAIAGVVSTNPAHLMNDQLEAEHVVDVALIGRVPCKVVGQVRKGDLLISSDEPGHAQAYKDMHNPPTGSVIGKAIQNKDVEEPGVIEVLVGRL